MPVFSSFLSLLFSFWGESYFYLASIQGLPLVYLFLYFIKKNFEGGDGGGGGGAICEADAWVQHGSVRRVMGSETLNTSARLTLLTVPGWVPNVPGWQMTTRHSFPRLGPNPGVITAQHGASWPLSRNILLMLCINLWCCVSIIGIDWMFEFCEEYRNVEQNFFERRKKKTRRKVLMLPYDLLPNFLSAGSEKRILLTKSETKKMYKESDPIFRCTTPSTGQRLGEVVVGTLYQRQTWV